MTLPDYTGGRGFYDPSYSYKGITPGYTVPQGSMAFQKLGEEDPAGIYYGYTTQQGYGGLGSRSQAMQQLLPYFQRGFGAARAFSNYQLNFPEYLVQTKMTDLFNNLSYQGQGLDPGRFQSRYRWGFRPGG